MDSFVFVPFREVPFCVEDGTCAVFEKVTMKDLVKN
jgi:hypothetical protein